MPFLPLIWTFVVGLFWGWKGFPAWMVFLCSLALSCVFLWNNRASLTAARKAADFSSERPAPIILSHIFIFLCISGGFSIAGFVGFLIGGAA